MLSAGNDIVSFAEIDPVRTKQAAFYKKILTDWEVIQYQKLADTIAAFEVYVWLLWSVKEAAFKFLRRLNSQIVFSPSKFIVGDIKSLEISAFKSLGFDETKNALNKTTWHGHITVDKTELMYFSVIGVDYVHSIIHQVHNSGESYAGVKHITDTSAQNQSSEVRKLCLDQLRQLMPGIQFNINKSEQGVPFIYNIDEKVTYPVSFSHHGHFVAYSFVI
jgi:phosphopantetheinyl transferase (holo-ACP synthase)